MLQGCEKPSSLVVWSIRDACRVVVAVEELRIAVLLLKMEWLWVVSKNRIAVMKYLPLVTTKYEEEQRQMENGAWVVKKVPVSLLELLIRYGHLQLANELRWWDEEYKDQSSLPPLFYRPSYEVPCWSCQLRAARTRASIETPEPLQLKPLDERPVIKDDVPLKPRPKAKTGRVSHIRTHDDGCLDWSDSDTEKPQTTVERLQPIEEEEVHVEEVAVKEPKMRIKVLEDPDEEEMLWRNPLCPPSPPHKLSDESTTASSPKDGEVPQVSTMDAVEEDTCSQDTKEGEDPLVTSSGSHSADEVAETGIMEAQVEVTESKVPKEDTDLVEPPSNAATSDEAAAAPGTNAEPLEESKFEGALAEQPISIFVPEEAGMELDQVPKDATAFAGEEVASKDSEADPEVADHFLTFPTVGEAVSEPDEDHPMLPPWLGRSAQEGLQASPPLEVGLDPAAAFSWAKEEVEAALMETSYSALQVEALTPPSSQTFAPLPRVELEAEEEEGPGLLDSISSLFGWLSFSSPSPERSSEVPVPRAAPLKSTPPPAQVSAERPSLGIPQKAKQPSTKRMGYCEAHQKSQKSVTVTAFPVPRSDWQPQRKVDPNPAVAAWGPGNRQVVRQLVPVPTVANWHDVNWQAPMAPHQYRQSAPLPIVAGWNDATQWQLPRHPAPVPTVAIWNGHQSGYGGYASPYV